MGGYHLKASLPRSLWLFEGQGRQEQNARRIIPLTDRASALLGGRKESATSQVVFANRDGKPYVGTSMNHLHRDVCAPKVKGKRCPIFPADFVLHSLRHTMLSRLGKSGVDAFTIMRIAGHSSIVCRSGTSIPHQRRWSALSNGFSSLPR